MGTGKPKYLDDPNAVILGQSPGWARFLWARSNYGAVAGRSAAINRN